MVMTSLSQLIRRTAPLWRYNATNAASTTTLVLPKNIIQSHRPFLFMISASTSAIGILSHVALTDASNENDIYSKDTTSSKINGTFVSAYSFWPTSLLLSLRNYHTNNIRITYCDSAVTSNFSTVSSSSKAPPSLKRLDTSNNKRNALPDDGATDTTAVAPATTSTTTAAPTTKSNIQRQV
jgi:hypothetical protein